jgi:hypothetical protein
MRRAVAVGLITVVGLLLASSAAEASYLDKGKARDKTEHVAKRLCKKGCTHYAAKNCARLSYDRVVCDAIDFYPGSIGHCTSRATWDAGSGTILLFDLAPPRCV